MSKIEIAKMSDLDSLREDIPTETSSLANDSGFIVISDIPSPPIVPTKVSELENDSDFITIGQVPESPSKTSELTNDSGFITLDDIPSPPSVPTNLSQLTNDTGFITGVTGSEVSVIVDGMDSTNVQDVIAELKAMIEALSEA